MLILYDEIICFLTFVIEELRQISSKYLKETKLHQIHSQVPSVWAVNLKVAKSTPKYSLSTREKSSFISLLSHLTEG